MLYVEKSTPEHAFALAFDLRQEDKYEVALAGHTPLDALIAPFRYTRQGVNTYTVLNTGIPVAMFGVISTPQNVKHGAVWFLSSYKLDNDMRYFTKRTKKWVDYFLADYEYVYNYITVEHKKNIRWLKWLGFKFKTDKILVKNVEVLYFYRQIQGVSKDIQPIIGDIGPKWITDLS